jgi:excisionase family DNA binding protein
MNGGDRKMTGSELVADGWIDTRTAARLSGYRRAYIRQLAIAGRIEARKIGRDWLVNQESLEAYKAKVKPGRPRQDEGGDDE